MDNIKNHPLYRKHNIDSAMNALWEFYKSRFIALFLISLIMSGIIQYASSLIDFSDLQTMTDPMEMLEKMKEFIVPMLIMLVVSLLFSTILHYYVLHKPLDDSQNILVSAVKALKYYFPYLIIFILLIFAGSIAMVLGLMVLIVGIFFSILYVAMISFFILPVMMAENGSIDRTIVRTIKLSHSVFWPNMGWTAVFIILYLIVSMVLSGIVLLPFAGSFIKTFANPQDTAHLATLPGNPLYILLSSAINALTMPLFPVFAYIMYFNARAREEDVSLPSSADETRDRVRVEDLYAKPRTEESGQNTTG